MKKGQHFNWSGQEVASLVTVLTVLQYNAIQYTKIYWAP